MFIQREDFLYGLLAESVNGVEGFGVKFVEILNRGLVEPLDFVDGTLRKRVYLFNRALVEFMKVADDLFEISHGFPPVVLNVQSTEIDGGQITVRPKPWVNELDPMAGTQDEIMDAAFEAVSKHGYAAVSISDINEEFEKSRSLLYYHYDSKDDILVSLLQYAVEEFTSKLDESTGGAQDELELLIEELLPTELDETDLRVQSVILELRAQAVTNEKFREQFTEVDDEIFNHIVAIIERGIAAGEFEAVEPELVAAHILATLTGARNNHITTSRECVADRTRASLFDYLDQRLYD